MSDLEFDLLDELYFVTPYSELLKQTRLTESELLEGLQILFLKGWVKCFTSVSEELDGDQVDLPNRFKDYYYLASKEGLLAHNRI